MGLAVMLSLATVLSGCGGGGSSTSGNAPGTTPITGNKPKPGDALECKVGTTDSRKSFLMRYVPAVSSFPTGTNDSGTGSVNAGFYIADTEVTYELWAKVYQWATTGKDESGNPSTAIGAGKYTFVNKGAGSGLLPVTNVNWRDALVWCNALTEYYNATNGTNLACVYTCNGEIIRSSSTNTSYCDAAYVNPDAKGFRLPTSVEWELAARYIEDTNQDGMLTSGEYYPGSFASGADADYTATTAMKEVDNNGYIWTTAYVAVFNTCTKEEGYDGDSWWSNSVTSKQKVKSLNPNKLKIYDMSGNVWEWCFDKYNNSDSTRILRGGAWDSYMDKYDNNYYKTDNLKYLQIGYVNPVAINTCTDKIGLRLVRTF